MSGQSISRLFAAYAAVQALAIATFFFVPVDTWPHAFWQVLIGWTAAGSLVVAVGRRRQAGALAWYFFGAGVFLNATGILAATIIKHPAQIAGDPSVVDVFYLALFPGLAVGTALLIRHRSVERDWASLVDAAIITTGFGLLSWVFLIRPAATDAHLSMLARTTAIAYPVGDLVILGMMVRIVLGGGIRNWAFRLMVGALLAFLGADTGWAVLGHLGLETGSIEQHLLESGSMMAYALVGASALHPSASAVAETSSQRSASLSPLLVVSLTTASLMAPAVLWVEVACHNVVDGAAIALCATVSCGLVVARMTRLVRRVEEHTQQLAERNRAVRRVLDTVNEGLLRVAHDGTLILERSAMIDRWFRPFGVAVPFVDYIREFDEQFALSFQLGYEALLEAVLPAEVALAQLPSRLRSNGRDYKVAYLPVVDRDKDDGLLVVIHDVTDQLLRAQQDAEQRELLAMFQALTRDRAGFLSFLDEAQRLLGELSSATLDLPTQRRLLHTLKGNVSMASLHLVAQLCHRAEDDLEERQSTPWAAIDALQARWIALTNEFQMLVGEQGPDAIAVEAKEVDELCAEIARGLSPLLIAERLASWRDEPVERPLARLGNYARALAGRLGKGSVAIQLEGKGMGMRLDRDRWAPLWSELVHVVRNAVDHGWETPEERRAAGKSSQPKLRLSAYMTAHDFTIELEDDGRGINWDAIRHAAATRGLPVGTEQDLTTAVLSAGVSDREEVGPLSGRGVGMAAVLARVEEFAGRIEVTSRKGQGTCWQFCFPPSSLTCHRTSIAGSSCPSDRAHTPLPPVPPEDG